jgi:hypothetical protein
MAHNIAFAEEETSHRGEREVAMSTGDEKTNAEMAKLKCVQFVNNNPTFLPQ